MPPLSIFLFSFLSLCVRAEMVPSLTQHPVTASILNVSSQLFPNTSSSNFSDFPYIIPYGQTQDCNIYGPVCQTGSITVGVNLSTATTNTVLPCSSYLSAQFAHLNYEQYGETSEQCPNVNDVSDYISDLEQDPGAFEDCGWSNVDVIPLLRDWNINFGRSPECRSYAEAMSSGKYTFSECGGSNTVISASPGVTWDYPSEIPPGLVRLFDATFPETCCGNCSLNIPAVRLYYFPNKSTIDCHNNQTSEYQRPNLTSVVSAGHLKKRVHSLIANGSTAVISGHTFTSPSIYLQFMGTAAVTDECTTVGPKLTNPILTLPPGVLTTWRPAPYGVDDDYTEGWFIGDVWSPDDAWWYELGSGFGYTAPLDVNDLACPTWGLGLSTATNGTTFTTVGPPWLPLIQPPTEMFSLNPTWAAMCTAILNNPYVTIPLDFFDPPFALTPAPLLVPTTIPRPASKPAPAPTDPTSVPEQADPFTEAAKPASLPNDPAAPAETGNPGKSTPALSPDVASPDPARSANLPENPVAPSKNEGDPPTDPSSDPSSDPKVPVVPLPQPVEDPQTQAQGLGAIIYNAFGKSATPILTVAGQTFTPNPSAFSIAGTVVSAGGPAVTIGRTAISLGQHGALKIGSSTINLLTPSNIFPNKVYTVAGQVFTPNPSAFSVAGTTISAGGPAATVGGTIISLEPSGTLVIGSSTIPLLPQTAISSDVDIDGLDVIAQPSFAVVDGMTVSAAAAGVTVSGNVVSLEAGGATLDIGTGRFILPTPVTGTNGSRNVQAFVGGQSKGLYLSVNLVWGVCGALILLMWH
ncbi:hypothetical protein JMJ35_005673 [Cladonia borealis]|uniref:Uncharacterized protein n=1 Tax=Cladonia borealis TaxID=184061 RepID=A0AA39R1X1_9LECA|nr:hypothetical protein JMJ35_005673 [Cladonia borealis]